MLITALVFFAILSFLVFIHEFGHYIVARFIGVHVEEFGLGLPPRMFGKKIGGTIYSLNWLPVGGFVRLAGEDEVPNRSGFTQKNVKHLFWARSKKERAAILVAGVTMNFLLAVGITGYLLTQGIMEPSGHVRVEKVQPESPAETVGLSEGDIVTAIEQKQVSIPKDLIETTRAHLGEQVTLTVIRDGKELRVIVTPRKDPPAGQGALGIVITDLTLHTFSWTEIPYQAVRINVLRARDMVTGIGSMIGRIMSFKSPGSDVAGPIGIARFTGEAVKFGWKAVLEFMAILSLNLAVLNILPIPALDGGRLAFVFLEKLIGKKLRPAFEHSAHQIGIIILVGLIFLVSINDILKLARGL